MPTTQSTSFLAQWIIDISTISSILGLLISVFLLVEARKIRQSFLRRARLPEVLKELNTSIKKISDSLKSSAKSNSWEVEKNTINEQYGIVRGLLENISSKLPEDERSHVNVFINQLLVSKFYFWKDSLIIKDEELGWKLYTDLSRVATRLEQLRKDSRWD